MRPLSVIFIVPNLGHGGAERHMSSLAPALAARGWQVEVLALDGGGPFESDLAAAGIPTRILRGRKRLPRAIRYLLSVNPAVLITRGYSSHFLGWLMTRRGCCWIVNWHRGPSVHISLKRRLLMRLIAPRCSAVAAVDRSQLGVLRRLGFDTRRTVVIANGVVSLPDRPRPGGKSGAVVVTLVASLRPEKRIDVFIDAVARARRLVPGLEGRVVGGGPAYAELSRRAGRAGNSTRLMGPRNDVPRLLAETDIFCLTSDAEAAPYAILEAMAAGLPVVATRVGGVPEMVADAGIVVPPGDPQAVADALVTLAQNRLLRDELAERARERQQREFDAEIMTERYASLIQRAIDEDSLRGTSRELEISKE